MKIKIEGAYQSRMLTVKSVPYSRFMNDKAKALVDAFNASSEKLKLQVYDHYRNRSLDDILEGGMYDYICSNSELVDMLYELSDAASPVGWDVEDVINDSYSGGLKEMKIKKVESVDDQAYEAFKDACQANETYKAVAAICSKYGYKPNAICCVEVRDGGKLDVDFGVVPSPTNRYLPEVYYLEYGKDKSFKIQTSSFGSLDLEEHKKWMESQVYAHKLVEELSQLDLTTLYRYESN